MTDTTDMLPESDSRTDELERLVEFASLFSAARDALTDDMVGRLSSALSEGIILLDRLTRNEGLLHLLQELERPENQQFLISLSNAFTATSRDLAASPPAGGGVMDLCRIGCKPGTQEGLRLLSLLGAHLSDSMRELHSRGG